MLQTTLQLLQGILEMDATISADERRNMLESLKQCPKAEAKVQVSARLLNYRQAADMLGLSKQTVSRSLGEEYTPQNVGGCTTPPAFPSRGGSATRQPCGAWQV